MTTALLAFATSGCVEPLDNNVPGIDPDAVYLPIRLYIPGAIPATKVSPSDINGLTGNAESQIHCVQVWMFTHNGSDEESALAYAEAGTLTGQKYNLPNGSGYYAEGYWSSDYTYELSMRIPKSILKGSNLKFDFYVLANAKSIGTTTLQAMTRGALKASMFGGTADYFGTTTPVTEVGASGLPISGFFNKGSNEETAANASGVDLSFLKEDKVFEPEDFYENLPIVQLERAVSRIRFAFAKPTGMTGVQIIKVEIDGDQIPTSTYVFPRENGQFPAETEYEYPTNIGYTTILQGTAATQTTPATPLLSDTQIASYENPEDLKSTSNKIFNVANKSYNGKAPLGTNTETTMNSQEYNDLLDDYTTSKYVYLRESGKPIKGRITYSLDGGTTTKTADFFMKPPTGTENPYDFPNTTNFYRNHSWTVYGYFKGGSLWIKPVLNKDWVYNIVDDIPQQYYKYEQTGEAHIVFSEKSQSLFGYGYTTSVDNSWNYVNYTQCVTEYSCSVNSTLGSWSTTPTFNTNKYFWVRTGITLSDGRTLYSPVVSKGPKEVTTGNITTTYNVTGISVQYATSFSDSESPSSEWSSEIPSWDVKNPFVWVKVTTTYSDNSSVDNIVCVCNKNDLYISPTITEWYLRRQDWNSEGHEHDVAQPVSAEAYPWKDWVHSQIVVAPGLNAANVPVYSNRIELITSQFTVPLQLRLTNPDDFLIVIYHDSIDENEVAKYEVADTYAEIPYAVAHNGGRTFFYVVPKETATPGATTSVFLVTGSDETHPNPNPLKLPFNSDAFPGSQDYTEVYFYCIDEATFQDYYTTQPVNIKAYGKTGEVTI